MEEADGIVIATLRAAGAPISDAVQTLRQFDSDMFIITVIKVLNAIVEAQGEGVTPDRVVSEILKQVALT